MPVARGAQNVSADNNNVTEHALRLNSSLAMDTPFYTAYTAGYAPVGGKGTKPLIANDPIQTLLDKSKTTRAVSPVEKAREDEKVALWQAARRRRPSLQEGEGDLSPLVLDKEYTNEKRLGQCVTMVQRGLGNTTSSWTHSIRIIDDENKGIGEADSSLSAQTSSGWGTLNLRPTIKLSSQCSAVALEDASGQALPSGAEAIDDVIDHTPMVYQIPEEVMREAMLASLNTRAAYWQYSLYQERGDPSGDKVKVHYCTSKETTEQIAQLFLDKEVVGFDIEWKPQAQFGDGIKKNVSLIQIASEERIALFHVGRYAKGDTIDDLLAPTLKRIMESSEIIKVGVSVKADCTRLGRFLGIEARGLFELSHLYKLIKYSAGDVKKINKKLVSLAQQVEEHLQLPMWKGDVRSSDWSQKLNYEQIKCR